METWLLSLSPNLRRLAAATVPKGLGCLLETTFRWPGLCAPTTAQPKGTRGSVHSEQCLQKAFSQRNSASSFSPDELYIGCCSLHRYFGASSRIASPFGSQ